MKNNHYLFRFVSRKMKKPSKRPNKRLGISCFFIIPFLLIGFTSFSQHNTSTNTALDFDGTDDYVQLTKTSTESSQNTSNVFLFEDGITIQAWVKLRSLSTGYITADRLATVFGTTTSFSVISTDSKISFLLGVTPTFDGQTLESKAELTTGRWTHIACTYDNMTMKVYINGVLSEQKRFSVPIALNNNDIYIGGSSPQDVVGSYFDGAIDDLRFHRKALDAAAIAQSVGQGASSDGLIVGFQFDEGTAGGDNTMFVDETTVGYSGNRTRPGNLENFALMGDTSNFVDPSFVPLTTPKITSVSYNGTTTAITASTSTVRVVNSVATASIAGTAGVGNTVTLYRGTVATSNTTTVDTDGNYTFTGVALAAGHNNFKVEASKANHNNPEASAPVLIVRRPLMPGPPEVVVPMPLTKVASMTISGTADTDSYIRLSRAEGTFSVLNATSDANGNWSIANVPLVEGDNTFTATAANSSSATDAQSPSSSPAVVVLDTQAPLPPAITAIAFSGSRTVTGTALNDPIITERSGINPSGTGEIGSTIQFIRTTAGNTFQLSQTIVVDNSGAWSFPLGGTAVAEGENLLTVRAVDAAGNISVASQAITVIYNTEITTDITRRTSGAFTNSNPIFV